MSSIDKRVVEMEFDNRQFERGVKDTLASLDALKEGLKLDGATKGLQDIENAGKNTNLGGIADAVDHISSRFSALGAIGFSVIQNLTNSALDFAKKMGGMVFDPLVSGGKRRALNIEQAKFQFRGLGVNVKDAMADALFAVKGTAFGLDEAAKAASQLSASQVELGDDMKGALRGISGVAAMTNSSYEDTARIFTRVAGQGRVMAVDLNSIAARGLNASAVLAESMGTTEAAVREMVTKGEIDFDTFSKAMDDAFGENATKANETYTGSLANMRAAFSRIGASFFTPWLMQQRDLFNALTPVIDDVGDALKPVITAMSRFTGRQTNNLIGFLEGLDLTRLELVVGPFLNIVNLLGRAFLSIVNPMREAFREIFPPMTLEQLREILLSIRMFLQQIKMGSDTTDKLRRSFAGLFAVFSIGWTVVKEVAKFLGTIFDMVFSGSGGFLDATSSIGDFFVALDQAIKNGEGLTKFFDGLAEAVKGPIDFIRDLASALFSIGTFDAPSVDRITEALKAFEPLTRLGDIGVMAWERVLSALKDIWELFRPLADVLMPFFRAVGDVISDTFAGVEFSEILETIRTGLLGGIFLMLQRAARNMGNTVGSISHNLTEPFRRLTFTLTTMQNTLRAMTLMQIAIAVGLLAASVVALSNINAADLTRALTAITVMFTQLLASLQLFTMIGGVKGLIGVGGGLILLAIALRVLVSSVKALSELDWPELRKGLTGVAALLGAVAVAVKIMSGNLKGMFLAGAGIALIAVAIGLLADSVGQLSELEWEEMGRGLTGVAALLTSLAIFTKLTAVNKTGVLQGAGIILLATGIRILAESLGMFSQMEWGEIGKGVATLGGILAAFAIFSAGLQPAGLIRAGISLVIVGGAMHILADAIRKFSNFDWEEIEKGLTVMAASLTIIAVAMAAMTGALPGAASTLIVAASLAIIAPVLQQFADMDWKQIGRSMTVLAGGLAIIAAALYLMSGGLPGALALVVTAAGLALLAPALVAMSKLSWGEIGRGLTILTAALTIFGIAGLVMGPVVPVLIGLGIAIGLIGIGLGAAGAGVFLFAAGLTALAAAGAAGTAAMVTMVSAFAGLLPMIARQLGHALVAFAEVIATAGPALLEAMITIMMVMIEAVEENSPEIIELFGNLALQMMEKLAEITPDMTAAALTIMLGILQSFEDKAPLIIRALTSLAVTLLENMEKAVPLFARAATSLMVAILESIEANLGDVVDAGADVVIAFIRGLARNALKILDAGAKAIILIMNGIAIGIRQNSAAFRRAGGRIASAILSGMTGGLSDRFARLKVVRAAWSIGRLALGAAMRAIGASSPSKEFHKIGIFANEGLANGLLNSAPLVDKAASDVGEDAINAMKRSISGMADVLSMETDMSPVIRPVLDLSEIRKDASQISSFMPNQQVAVDMAYANASRVAVSHQQNKREERVDERPEVSRTEMTYNQYNRSPKALSSAEIYRQTRNQLSKTKGALTPNASQST